MRLVGRPDIQYRTSFTSKLLKLCRQQIVVHHHQNATTYLIIVHEIFAIERAVANIRTC